MQGCKLVVGVFLGLSGGACIITGDDTPDDGNLSASGAGDGIGRLLLTVSPGNGVSGLDPGTALGSLVDGWTVKYEQILVVLGDVKADTVESQIPLMLTGEMNYLFDLRQVSPEGVIFKSAERQVTSVKSTGYSTQIPTSRTGLGLATATDLDLMVKGGYSIYVKGTMTNPKGESCAPDDPADCSPASKIVFTWGLAVPTNFSGCDGFTVSDSEDTELTLSIPGDHWFLSGFSADAERTSRQAQWVADADLDRDGETTVDELKMIKAGTLFTSGRGYDLNGAPIPIMTAYDFLAAQVRTLGINGVNGCTRATVIE